MGATYSSLAHQFQDFIHAPGTYRSAYLMGWGSLFGFEIWNSFIGGIVAYKTLPRETFGTLQSHLIPAYLWTSTLFSAGLIALEVKLRPALIRAFRQAPGETLRGLKGLDFWTSTAGLAVVTMGLHAVNAAVVTPKATEVMFRRHRLQRLEGRATERHPSDEMKKLNASFRSLHGMSSSLNVAALFTTGLIGWKVGNKGLGPSVAGGLGVLGN